MAAAQRYGSYLAALRATASESSGGLGNSNSGSSNNVNLGNTSQNTNASSPEEALHAIIWKMYRNSISWANVDEGTRKTRDKENLDLGAQLSQFGITAKRGEDGVWYINQVGSGAKLYDVYWKYCITPPSKYHTGGIAGDMPTTKQNEVLAILEKGEAILDSKKEEGLYRLVDFTTILSEKLGRAIDTSPLFNSLMTAQSVLPGLDAFTPNNIVNERTNSVRFGDVYIYGTNSETIEEHRKINRQFTNEVLKQLNIKR